MAEALFLSVAPLPGRPSLDEKMLIGMRGHGQRGLLLPREWIRPSSDLASQWTHTHSQRARTSRFYNMHQSYTIGVKWAKAYEGWLLSPSHVCFAGTDNVFTH